MLHWAHPVAPDMGASSSSPQARHMEAPAEAAYEPGEHGIHVSQPPGLKVPGGQFVHVLEPVMEYVPGPHGSHVD